MAEAFAARSRSPDSSRGRRPAALMVPAGAAGGSAPPMLKTLSLCSIRRISALRAESSACGLLCRAADPAADTRPAAPSLACGGGGSYDGGGSIAPNPCIVYLHLQQWRRSVAGGRAARRDAGTANEPPGQSMAEWPRAARAGLLGRCISARPASLAGDGAHARSRGAQPAAAALRSAPVGCSPLAGAACCHHHRTCCSRLAAQSHVDERMSTLLARVGLLLLFLKSIIFSRGITYPGVCRLDWSP